MAKVDEVMATQPLIDVLKRNLDPSFERASQSIFSHSAAIGLQFSFNNSPLAWGMLLDDRPVAVLGVYRYSILEYCGLPWFFATDEIARVKITVLRRCRQYISLMFDRFTCLETYVYARNTVSKNWLRWCGFHMDAAAPFGPNRARCHRAWLDRQEFVYGSRNRHTTALRCLDCGRRLFDSPADPGCKQGR